MSFALVTGAAKGIGRAIAEELAIRKYHLILVDKDADELYASTRMLESRYIVQVIPLHIDLTSAGGVEQLISFTQPYHEWLNVIVNNAGYGLNELSQIPLHNQLNIIDFNITALVKIAHAYTPVLKKSVKGFFLNIACTSEAYQLGPDLNVYESTHAFVLSFTKGLQQELSQSNVQVSCLSRKKATSYFLNNSKKNVAQYNLTPETLANIAVNGLFKGIHEIVPIFSTIAFNFFTKLFSKKSTKKTLAVMNYKKAKWIDPAMNNTLFKTVKNRRTSVSSQDAY